MTECKACGHKHEYDFEKGDWIGDPFIIVSQDLHLVACPKCYTVILERDY